MSHTTAQGSSEMSKADRLRGFVTERLSAASREILAAVETIVAAYEEEASGFKLELSRQRRELELLQPRVTVGLQTSRNQGSAEEEDGEDEESCQHLKNLDSTGPKRSSEAPCGSVSRKRSRTQKNINLIIRFLKDPNTKVLSKNVMKKSPMVTLKCPPGLQEDDFLDLLRSTISRLDGDDKPFDILASDQRRRLQPLNLKSLTPEEIHRNLKSSGPGKPALYIRLQTGSEAQEEVQFLQTGTSSCGVSTCEEPRQNSRSYQEQNKEAEDDDGEVLRPDEDSVAPSAGGSESDSYFNRDEEEAHDSDSSWKPEESEEKQKRRDSKVLKITEKQRIKCLDVTEDHAVFSCKVCRATLGSEVLLVKHAWTHEQEAGSVCGACGESVEVLMDHFQNQHRTDDCQVCGESFLCALSLNEHVAAHSGEKPYQCEVCGGSFALKATLEDHRSVHEPGHTSPTCQQQFRQELQLKAHRRTHSKRKPFLCGVCGKLLCDKRSLSRHKMTHSGERPHSCQVCGRGFKLPSTLKQHEKIHTTRERSYLCDVCCKMFLTSKELAIHMRTHTDERPFRCDQCGRGFTTKGRLSMHLRIHTGETPYPCPYCGRSFKRRCNLNDHVATHTGAKPHVCGICGKRCARKAYLTVHMRTHNGERPYRCSLCDRAFTQSHCLKTHWKSHHAEHLALKIN